MFDIDEIMLNLINDYPRTTTCWLARAIGCSQSTADRHVRKWIDAGVIHSYAAGAYTNYERIVFFPDAMPDFFAKPAQS